MPCQPFKWGNASGFICGRGRRIKRCYYCTEEHEFLCDFPIGKTKKGKNKDCSRPLCADCTQKGVSPNVDFCKDHFPLAKAAYERRLAAQRIAG
jgi:hypothetical protein